MGKKGSSTTTTTVQQQYDPKASRAMTKIAQRQQKMSEEQWRMYKKYFQDYEIAAAEANLDLLPHITAVSRKLYDESLEGIDVEERADQAAGNVLGALRSSRGAAGREMSRYGVDPGSSRFRSGLAEEGTTAASLIGGARNRAISEGEKENYVRLGSALGLRGYAEAETPDTYGRAVGTLSQAANTYAPLASRVLSSTRVSEQPKSTFWDFAGNVLGQAAGAYAGKNL